MPQLKSLTVLALAAAGLLAAGCSSSSSSSSSVPAATSPAASATAAATSPAATPAASSPAAAVGKPSAADCKIIKPISASAIAKLTPLSTESKAKATAGMQAYIATLTAAEAKLTSAGGKKAVGDFIASLEKSQTESTSQATTLMIAALGTLGTACP
jgi:hypothetical protein